MLRPVDIAAWRPKWTINVDLQGLFKPSLMANLLGSLGIIMNHNLESRVCALVSFVGAQGFLGVVFNNLGSFHAQITPFGECAAHDFLIILTAQPSQLLLSFVHSLLGSLLKSLGLKISHEHFLIFIHSSNHGVLDNCPHALVFLPHCSLDPVEGSHLSLLPQLLSLVFLLKESVQAVGPLSHASDVQGELAAHLRGAGDGEGVPLAAGHTRDLDKHPVPGTEVEPCWSLNDQLSHSGWQQHSCLDHSLAVTKEVVQNPVGNLYNPDEPNDTDPLPELRGMEQEEDEISPVEHVGVVEGLKVSPSPHKRQGAEEHDCHDGHERHAAGVGLPAHHPEHVRLHGQYPLPVGPRPGLSRARLTQETAIVVDHLGVETLGHIKAALWTVLCHVRVLGLDGAAGGDSVERQYLALAIVVCPVFVGQLDKLDRVGLDIYGKVGEMTEGVEEALEEDEEAD